MNAKTRVMILKIIMVIEIIGGALLVVQLVKTNSIPEIYSFPFIALAVLWVILLYFVPVRCYKPGCKGWMKTNWIKASPASESLQYVCSDCGEIFETGIGVGLGEPW